MTCLSFQCDVVLDLTFAACSNVRTQTRREHFNYSHRHHKNDDHHHYYHHYYYHSYYYQLNNQSKGGRCRSFLP